MVLDTEKFQRVKGILTTCHRVNWEEDLLLKVSYSKAYGFQLWELRVRGKVEVCGNSRDHCTWEEIATELARDMSFVEDHLDGYINRVIQKHGNYTGNKESH